MAEQQDLRAGATMSGRARAVRVVALALVAGVALGASSASAQPHRVELEVGEGRSAIVRPWRGTPSLCESSCTLELESGEVRLELTEPRRGPRPFAFELDGPARVELEVDSRRRVRIAGGVLAGLFGAGGVASLVAFLVIQANTMPCEEGCIDFESSGGLAAAAGILGASVIAGFAVGIGLTFVRDRVVQVGIVPGP